MNARYAYIALNMVDGIGPVKVRAMIDALGAPEAILQATAADLMRVPGIGAQLAARIEAIEQTLDIAEEIKQAGRIGVRIVTFIDDDYPEPLKQIYDPPLALYLRGTFAASDRHAVAVVGSRRTTHYGRTVADRLSYQLAKVGMTVVSGLARGVDTAAHEGALKGGGRTGAVLGAAIDRLYPPENQELADRVAAQGFVVSEFPLGTEPGKTTFPMRNRIVSGLCMGVVVVEAGRGSGALITANQAMEQGRSVFAVPGRIDSPSSKGCHQLIQQGARLVDDIDDILEEFSYLIPPETKKRVESLDDGPTVSLTGVEQAIVRELWAGPKDIDALTRTIGLSVAEISTHAMALEMKRVARMRPGRMLELAPGIKSGS